MFNKSSWKPSFLHWGQGNWVSFHCMGPQKNWKWWWKKKVWLSHGFIQPSLLFFTVLGDKIFYGTQEFLYNADYLNSTLLVFLFGLVYFTIFVTDQYFGPSMWCLDFAIRCFGVLPKSFVSLLHNCVAVGGEIIHICCIVMQVWMADFFFRQR
jgi:hypothetical protein